MSDNIPPIPTVELLIKELKDVTNWYVFGATLGIPVSKLDCIKKDYSDVGDRKVQMFYFWLQYKLDASWKTVIQALEQNNYLVLAATLSKEYLLSENSNTSEKEQEGSTSLEANESTAEIRATAAVVERLRDLETSFTKMLTDLLDLLTECKCDLSKAQFFLDDHLDTEEFRKCTNFDELLRQLRRGHVDTFNTYYLQQLVACFKKDQLTERIKVYEAEKEYFLKDTTVIQFQQAVVSRVDPVKPSQMKDLIIKISKTLAKDRTLKDMEELASRAFEECQLEFVRIHVKSGSVIISVFFPETLADKLEHLAHKNAAVFKDAGVEEVTVDGRVVFPSTLEEELKDIPTASLKEIYTDFYHRLVEAVSNEHTCQSLLSSSALLSEKIAQLKVTGSSFLKTVGLEEEPHLLVPLVSAMSGVEQLQTLAGEISATMRSNQAKAITQDTERQPVLDGKERKQLVADIERLASDKADLVTRLQCCEEELKTANELSKMREKAIAGMMAAAGKRKKELEEAITLKSVSGIHVAVQTTAELEPVPLQAGWKAYTTSSGYIYYADHNTQITQWQDPRTIEPSLDLPTLPTYSETLGRIQHTSAGSRYERKQPKRITYLTLLSHPTGMVISKEGHLIVAKHDSITIIIADSGEVINRFGKYGSVFNRFGQYGSEQVEFNHPKGVSLTQDGHIIVADKCNNHLQVLTVEGALVALVGSKGSQPLQFYYPFDVAVHHNGKLFVTELLNHRIQVLNPDLSYSHCFGSKGDYKPQLNRPHGIAIDQDGMVYVSDQGHRQIKKFTPEGKVLAVFNNTTSLFSPYGLCVDSNNILYVVDSYNNTVCVYNTSGQFLGYIGNSDGSSFDAPRFIVSDKGRLYISDSNGVITYKCYQQ